MVGAAFPTIFSIALCFSDPMIQESDGSRNPDNCVLSQGCKFIFWRRAEDLLKGISYVLTEELEMVDITYLFFKSSPSSLNSI